MSNGRRSAGAHTRTARWLAALGLVLCALAAGPAGGPSPAGVAAQSDDYDWQPPINLSNSAASSSYPAIVADGHGFVHVFWSEEVDGESILDVPQALVHNGNTIYYTRWDGEDWSEPVDILFVPGDPIADYISAAVDRQNGLHLVWTGQDSFYYSTAPAHLAQQPQSWSTPVVVATGSARSMWESSIAAAEPGQVHVAYATRGPDAGIFYVASTDGGRNWGAPVQLSWPLERLEKGYMHVKLVLGPDGVLHCVWGTYEKDGYGQAVYYARSADGGGQWSEAQQMGNREAEEYGVLYAYVAALPSGETHIVYIDGPWHIGRWHRVSPDAGLTWSEPSQILDSLEGVNGYTLLVVDGLEQVHLVVTMRTREQVGGLFHSKWLGTAWSPVTLEIPDRPETGPGAHWTAVTIRLGNELHVVWNTNFSSQAGEIWYSRASIPGVPAQSPKPTPAPSPTVGAAAPVAPSPTPPPTPAWVGPAPAASTQLPEYLPLLAAAVGSLAVVVGTIIVSRLMKARR
ncbi:MAG: hypothetical protein GX605_09910 [Chloroflexi bacterium]|nr:hypothetical protein [Chloroflexota bacterium]